MLLQVVAEGIPSAADTHHHVATQNSDVDRDLGVADPIFALSYVDHRKLCRACALLYNIAYLKTRNNRDLVIYNLYIERYTFKDILFDIDICNTSIIRIFSLFFKFFQQ